MNIKEIWEDKMKPFIHKDYVEPSFLEKLFKKSPNENFLVDVNNLLASSSLDDLENSQIVSLEQRYGLQNSGKKFKQEFLSFVTLFLGEHLGNWGSDLNDYQSALKLQRILKIPEDVFDEEYRLLAGELFEKHSFELISLSIKYDDDIQNKIEQLKTKLDMDSLHADDIVNQIRIRIVRDYFSKMVEDQRVSPDEIASYEKLCSDMHVNAQFDQQTFRLVEKYKQLWKIDNEDLPVLNTEIFLQKSEQCHFFGNAKLFENRKVTTRVNYGGPTFRIKIAKGIYYRTGSYGVSRNTEDVMTLIDTGTLYITNKRILFTGSINNKTIKYNQIIDFTPYTDGIEIVKDSGKNPTFQLFTNDGDILATTLARILRDNQ